MLNRRKFGVDIGVNEGTLGNWVRTWKQEYPEAGGDQHSLVEWAKHKALQVENAELKREINFLGKVSVYFARQQR